MDRKYFKKKYRHLGLYFAHGSGWDKLTLIAAMELDSHWPAWMPNWFKRLNNRLLYAYGGRSLVRTTKFYHSRFRKLFPFIKEYPRFTQIKEKYGGLRLYGAGSLETPLESLSYLMCEDCGSGHEIGYTEGWIKTLCKKCAEKGEYTSWKAKNDNSDSIVELLMSLAAFNKLDNHIVKTISDVFEVDAETICKKKGITYWIK